MFSHLWRWMVATLALATLLSTGSAHASVFHPHTVTCGTWNVVASPNLSDNNYLTGLAVISPTDIWSVGYAKTQGAFQTLTEHYDGTNWTIVPSPNNGSFNQLFSVTALSASDVWAVGTYVTSQGESVALIEHWNGAIWSIVASPSGGTGLTSIVGIASDDIWAVGTGSNQPVLTEHYDGQQWIIIPNPSSSSSVLESVTASSSSDVWAVGDTIVKNGTRTFIEHWNGTQWSIVSSANTWRKYNSLYGVTAVPGSTRVWATGNTFSDSSNPKLVERWDGTQWGLVTSPAPQGSYASTLAGVSARTWNDLWSVGWATMTNGRPHAITLTEHWNGKGWSIIASPSPAFDASLAQVAVVPGTSQVWAVGNTYDGNVIQTLIEEYC